MLKHGQIVIAAPKATIHLDVQMINVHHHKKCMANVNQTEIYAMGPCRVFSFHYSLYRR